jgi:hypothetical protein
LKYGNQEAWYKAAKVYQKGDMQSPCEPRNVGVVAHAIVEAEERVWCIPQVQRTRIRWRTSFSGNL